MSVTSEAGTGGPSERAVTDDTGGTEATPPGNTKDKAAFEVPGFAAAAALVVAVFAAIGLSGDLLARAVRNSPGTFTLVVGIVLGIVGVGAAALALQRRQWVLLVLALALTGALIYAVAEGADSVGEREQPRVLLSAEVVDQTVTITVTARGSGLKSDEVMLVQVQAVNSFGEDGSGLARKCGFDVVTEAKKAGPGPLLLWEQAGPDRNGTTEVESTVQAQVGEFEGVCALAALHNDPKRYNAKQARSAIALLRLIESA